MSDSLIVIAYHNGSQYLEALLDSLYFTASDILVVDTGSTAEEQARLRSRNVMTAYLTGGYCVAAYRHGFELFPHKQHYFFMHDSMRCKEPGFLPVFARHSPVAAWIGFSMDWGTPDSPEAVWGRSWYGDLVSQTPPNAIFGPIFYAEQNAMRSVLEKGLWPQVTDRAGLQGSERGLAVAFHRAGYTPGYLEPYDNDRIDVHRDYRFFDKYRPNRP